ncbi:hypothetical protein HMPREF9206_2125 [Cutibacterium acnes J139]|nr:hypothetical protein HMPREF9206_2125 [Cutibacterium acnes J139]
MEDGTGVRPLAATRSARGVRAIAPAQRVCSTVGKLTV